MESYKTEQSRKQKGKIGRKGENQRKYKADARVRPRFWSKQPLLNDRLVDILHSKSKRLWKFPKDNQYGKLKAHAKADSVGAYDKHNPGIFGRKD